MKTFDPYETLMQLVENHNKIQEQLKVVNTNIQEIAKAHNDLRNMALGLERIIVKIKETVDETTK